MNTLSRTAPEHQYLLPSGEWTSNPYEALNFKPAKTPIDFALLACRDVEVPSAAEQLQPLNTASPETFEAPES